MLETFSAETGQLLLLEDVFTPATISRVGYLRRRQTERQLKRALMTGDHQVLIQGPESSGKSSLIHHVLSHNGIVPITVYCTSGTSWDDIKIAAFDELEPFSSLATPAMNRGKWGKHALWFFKQLFSGALIRRNEYDYANDWRLTTGRLAQCLDNKNRILVLEDFHQLSRDTMVQVTELAAAISGQHGTVPQARLVLCGNAGIAGHAAGLFTSVVVPSMSKNELEEIIIRGEALLNIRYSRELRESFLQYAAGNSREVHQVCYKFCKDNKVLQRCEKRLSFNSTNRFQKV